MEIITAGIPKKDRCPILTRLKAFVVEGGIKCILETTIRDRDGVPIDLGPYFTKDSMSDSESSVPGEGNVLVKVREWVSLASSSTPVTNLDGIVHDASEGVVRVTLPATLTKQPGIYELSWGIFDQEEELVIVNRNILSVERSLFGDDCDLQSAKGTLTIQEIRMAMMDSHANENTLLGDVEFHDEQILLAIAAPIQQWNETPPPIRTYTTKNFPYRHYWHIGVMAKLYEMGAAHYRRNTLKTGGGGLQVSDKDKENEYLREAMRLKQIYDSWLQDKKIELNVKDFFGVY